MIHPLRGLTPRAGQRFFPKNSPLAARFPARFFGRIAMGKRGGCRAGALPCGRHLRSPKHQPLRLLTLCHALNNSWRTVKSVLSGVYGTKVIKIGTRYIEKLTGSTRRLTARRRREPEASECGLAREPPGTADAIVMQHIVPCFPFGLVFSRGIC